MPDTITKPAKTTPKGRPGMDCRFCDGKDCCTGSKGVTPDETRSQCMECDGHTQGDRIVRYPKPDAIEPKGDVDLETCLDVGMIHHEPLAGGGEQDSDTPPDRQPSNWTVKTHYGRGSGEPMTLKTARRLSVAETRRLGLPE